MKMKGISRREFLLGAAATTLTGIMDVDAYDRKDVKESRWGIL